MFRQIRPAIVMIVVMTVLTGLIYPLGMSGIAQLVLPHQANGSLIEKDGKVIGSELIGQNFTDDKYFHGRPSATTDTDPNDATKTVPAPYNAANSAGSNLGPTSQALIDRVKDDAEKLKAENSSTPIPVDLVTTSASGLDPDITPAAAEFQVPRVATARNLSQDKVRALVADMTQDRLLGILGEKRVNVLKLNLDVEEIIAAGIDVFETLNIQHVESLNDVVAKITRIRVRETVPDSILDQADDIEVIDLSPEDLIKRLREGKVYVPQQAERAIRHYFSPGNLTALRELALRRTAQRVDEQLLSHMRAHAISGPWAAGERVLVCVSEAPSTAGLIRYARRVADHLRAPWTAIYVETARTQRLDDAERDRIADFLRLAERLGASTITIPCRNIAQEVLAYAEANNS